MRRSGLAVGVVLAAVVGVSTAFNAGASSAMRAGRPTVVATVDLQRVINGMDELADREAELKSFGEELQSKWQKKDAAVGQAKAAVELLPADSPEQKERQQELRRLVLELKFEADFAQALLDEKRGIIYAGMFRKIEDAVERLAKQSGYDMVLSSDAGAEIPVGGIGEREVRSLIVNRKLLYTAESVDITNELLQLLNNEHKMGTP